MPAGSTYVSEELPHMQREGNSKQNTVMPRKRIREYGKQRQRKRRQLAVSRTPSLFPSRGNSSTSDNLSLISSSSQNDMSVCMVVFVIAYVSFSLVLIILTPSE